MILFLDDERDPFHVIYSDYRKTLGLNNFTENQNKIINNNYNNILIAKNFDQAVEIIKFELPDMIFFDHDLGEEKTGCDFAKWLVEYDLDGQIDLSKIEFYYHSANPIGRLNIQQTIKSYLRFKNEN